MSQFSNECPKPAGTLPTVRIIFEPNLARRLLGPSVLAILVLVLLFRALPVPARADGTQLIARGVVPGLAADAATSQPTTAGVSVGHITIDDSAGVGTGVWVYGDVTNATSAAVGNVTLTATALDSSGAALATRQANPVAAAIAPAAAVPFRLRLPAFTGTLARVTVTVDSFDPANAPASLSLTLAGPVDVPVGQPDKVTHVQPISPDLYGIDGSIWNNTSQTVQLNAASVALYDGDGNVVLVASSGPIAASDGSSPPVLEPGKSASYTVYISRAAYFAAASPTKLVAVVDSTTLSSGTP